MGFLIDVDHPNVRISSSHRTSSFSRNGQLSLLFKVRLIKFKKRHQSLLSYPEFNDFTDHAVNSCQVSIGQNTSL